MKVSVKALMMNAKEELLKGNKRVAGDLLNMGIGYLGKLTMEGVEATDGATVDRWKERFWFQLEVNDLIEA
ncbi:hypothetical protein UFOVP699_144 [uncultured Caudovirales phage]|uniref:Uncharacterized protein n=1 Tax=uncultured Caudovirales phage TaxID=2100421 RepID=A0A6J5NQQ9_9CAUD|nr:hypothetical protein UFOVP699_144 [uncultured Caudovirales phage]